MSQQIIEGYQLSPQQKHLWSLCEGGDRTPYAAQCAILIEGALDKRVLRSALGDVIERNEILRTTFDLLPDMTVPLQVVNTARGVRVAEFDLTGLSEQTQEARLETILRDAARGGDGHEDGGDLKVVEARLLADRHALLFHLPSLYADAAALRILMRELAGCYAARLRGEDLPEEPIQYADLSEWQNESLEAEGAEVGLGYWRRQASGDAPAHLPFEKEAEPGAGFSPGPRLSHVISRETVEKMERASALHGTSLQTLALACYFLLLSRLTDSTELTLGVLFDGRNYEELTSALGLFARFLPVNAGLPGEAPFPLLLSSLDAALAEAARWQELFTPEAAAPRGAGFIPFCFEYAGRETSVEAGPLRFTLLRASAYVSRFRLLLRCAHRGDGSLLAQWHYDSAVYAESEAARLAERWAAVVESLTARSFAARLDEAEAVGAGERAELLRRGRGARVEWGGAGCLHEIFEEQARRTPDAMAVVSEEESLTYRELGERSNRLARHLRSLGVGAEGRVGLMVERGAGMVTGLLGILKAGGAYVPLEAGQPAGRLSKMAADAGVRVLVTADSLRAQAQALGVETEVYLDADAAAIARESAESLEGAASEGNAAYVIFTSGSTGSAKGVCVEHRQLTNYVNAALQRLELPAGASYALVSTFAADLGNTVIFPALSTGGSLHVIASERAADADALAAYFAERPVDCLKIVPSHLAALMAGSRPELVLPRKRLVLGGEASSWELIDRIRTLAPACRILNHYGPTETTVGVLTCEVEDMEVRTGKSVPLGFPIANTQVYLLDGLFRPVPLGVPGEVHVGGANIARGYLNNARDTAARFIPNPFSEEPGERLYRTGDLARHLPDGSIEFLGRADDQVKVRGFRVEPGEIEAAICRHDGVEQAKVLARETPTGEKRLVAYVVPGESHAGTVKRRLRLEREGRLSARQSYELPNGMLVASQNRNETDFMYKEIFEQKIYLKHGVSLKDGDCVFDVGANIGMFSLFVGRTCRRARIYAFEPIPPLHELLSANADLYGLDVKTFKCGVSSEAGQQEFTYYPHLTLMSGRFADLAEDGQVVKLFEANRHATGDAPALDEGLLEEVLAERMTSESFACRLVRISDVLRENNVEHVDLLKIDVQKSELDVLRGIEESDWQKIDQVVLEVHDVDGRLGQVVSLLEAQGFRVVVEQEAMLKETGLFDVYCVRPGLEADRSGHEEVREATEKLDAWTSPEALLEDVRSSLRSSLPEYMIPSAFVPLDELPLTPNGKIDRRALPDPAALRPEPNEGYVAPRDEAERLLARIWGELLGVGRVGIRDNFFELGGDSILSIQVVARANRAGLRLSPRQLFRHQTVAELAAAARDSAEEEAASAEQGVLSGPVPLTPVEHYFFEQRLSEQHHFNQSLLLVLRRRTEAEHLRSAVAALITQHDALRLRFTRGSTGEWGQGYGDAAEAAAGAVREVDVSHLDGERQRQEIERECEATQRGMNLGAGGLFKVVLFETGGEQRLLLAAHHLVVDGVSWRVIVEDLERALGQAGRGEAVELGRKTSSYREWAERLRLYAGSEAAAGELEYWSEVERGEADKLPVDYPGGENTVGSSQTLSFSLNSEETKALLQEVPKAYGTQINDVLLTALAETFSRWSGQRQVLVDVEGHGRAEEMFGGIDLSRTVGWFTSIYPVRLDLEGIEGAAASLKHVKERLRKIPNGGIGYGVLRYLRSAAGEVEGRAEAEVSFNYLGQIDSALEEDSLFGAAPESQGLLQSERGRRRYLLEVTMAVVGGRLQVQWSYGARLHARETVERLAGDYLAALRRLIEDCRSGRAEEPAGPDFSLAGFGEGDLAAILSEAEFEGVGGDQIR